MTVSRRLGLLGASVRFERAEGWWVKARFEDGIVGFGVALGGLGLAVVLGLTFDL